MAAFLPTLIVAFSAIAFTANSGIAQSLESLPFRDATLELELGSLDDPVLGFSGIADLSIGTDRLIYVVEPPDSRVTVIRRDGSLVARLGRRGQGPGEFVSPGALGWSEGRLWVLDVPVRRVTYFSRDDLPVTRSFRSVPLGRGEAVAAVFPLPNDEFLGMMSRRFYEGDGLSRDHSIPLVRFREDGSVVDTLALIRESSPLRLYVGNRGIAPLIHDFPHFSLQRDGSAFAIVDRPFPTGRESRVTVTKILTSGDTIFARTLHGNAVPIPDSAWDNLVRLRTEASGPSSIPIDDLVALSPRPAWFAPASSARISQAGEIWIARERIPGSDETEWVVLSREGAPVFRTRLPATLRVYEIVEDEVWGVMPGELDVPYVQMYRVADAGPDPRSPSVRPPLP